MSTTTKNYSNIYSHLKNIYIGEKYIQLISKTINKDNITDGLTSNSIIAITKEYKRYIHIYMQINIF